MNGAIHPRRTGAVAAMALVTIIGFGAAQAQDARTKATAAVMPDAAQVERRLETVRTLVESSSAARQIESGASAEARGQRVKARQLVRLAEDAHAARDEASAMSLLDDAARQMLEGTRLAGGGRARGPNLGLEVEARIGAARALLAAQKRIGAEKSVAGSADTARQIERLLDQAAAHVAARRYAEAQPFAQQAYFLAKAAIGSMRSGDTLVRTLNFASKEEEYHYELDRNDTHRMLLELLARKHADDGMSGAFVSKARDLRRQAEASAGRGDFAAAVGLLEDATRELVRAIRSAGVFIPG